MTPPAPGDDLRAGREARAGRFPGPSLIPALTDIQRRRGWLPREELVALSRDARRPLYELEGLTSFYPHFRTTGPPPAVEVAVCRDLSCWLAGARHQLDELSARYADDADVVVRQTSCLGRCDCAPAANVNDEPSLGGDVVAAVELALRGELPETPAQRPHRTWPTDPYGSERDRYATLRAARAGELTPEEAIARLTDSGLRGMGGAGFPTGLKWEIVRGEPARPRYVICNADESEPGTFKDRQILAELPLLVLEGMLLGMWVVGAQEGWVFIRHEYGPEERVIRAELDRLAGEGLVAGEAGTDADLPFVDLFVSPGGYILGEETALIECMEGHRGEPRNKPPFPGSHGLWGKPTLMNSVETFAAAPIIVGRGPGWWRDQGIGDAGGLKFMAVSGDVETPGVYCIPMGTPIGELLDAAGGVNQGRRLAAMQPGGASSNFLGAGSLGVGVDFAALASAGSMLGSGALVVIAERTDLLAAAANVLSFFKNESCGKCVPCRVGSEKAERILARTLALSTRPSGPVDGIGELEETLRLTSICGLGQVALGPV
ncbi:MAG: NAD(P)H-dependent oxidoreductase subunit E, partial [Gaiellales bacterium]